MEDTSTRLDYFSPSVTKFLGVCYNPAHTMGNLFMDNLFKTVNATLISMAVISEDGSCIPSTFLEFKTLEDKLIFVLKWS